MLVFGPEHERPAHPSERFRTGRPQKCAQGRIEYVALVPVMERLFHRLEERVKAHVLICMLACYPVWHLRRAWAPLAFTDEDPPAPADPVAPARRSTRAQAKASRQHDEYGRPCHSIRSLLSHLATLTRNQVRFTGTRTTVPMLAEPTTAQREAFDLISVPIPLTLK